MSDGLRWCERTQQVLDAVGTLGIHDRRRYWARERLLSEVQGRVTPGLSDAVEDHGDLRLLWVYLGADRRRECGVYYYVPPAGTPDRRVQLLLFTCEPGPVGAALAARAMADARAAGHRSSNVTIREEP